MSTDEILTDDYVAGLLANEAKDDALRYSALGLEAFESRKKYVNPEYEYVPRKYADKYCLDQKTCPSLILGSCDTLLKAQITTTRRYWLKKPPSLKPA